MPSVFCTICSKPGSQSNFFPLFLVSEKVMTFLVNNVCLHCSKDDKSKGHKGPYFACQQSDIVYNVILEFNHFISKSWGTEQVLDQVLDPPVPPIGV